MLPLRLVLDTNVLVSAALKPQSLQRTALIIALTRPARLYVSPAILAEYASVLARPELAIRKGIRLQLLQLIHNESRTIVPTRRIIASVDPDDDKFLECAEAARADFLIYWQSAPLPTVLEAGEGRHAAPVRDPGGAAPSELKGGRASPKTC